MNENDLNHLLAKNEALVKAAETFKDTSNHMVSILAQAIKQRPNAVIAEEELKKVERVIATANCAQPDISHISTELSRRISNDVANNLESSIKYTIANTLKNAVIPVEHTHVVERNLKDVVDKRMTKTSSSRLSESQSSLTSMVIPTGENSSMACIPPSTLPWKRKPT